MIEFKTVKRKLKDLIPSSYNPRKLTEKQADDIYASLEKFGLAEIPVINTDNKIIAGHQRTRMLMDLKGGDYEIDVRIPNRLLNDSEEKEYNIRSNKNTGSWDWSKLENEFETKELEEWGFEEWEVSKNKDFSDDEFIDQEKKEELLKLKLCPHCKGEL